MIDIFLYSIAIPLTVMLILSATVFEVQGYDETLGEQEIKVFALSLADMLVSKNVTNRVGFASLETNRTTTRVYLPGNLTEIRPIEINKRNLGIPNNLNITLRLDDTVLLSENSAQARNTYLVKRYVIWKGEPAVLELEVSS